MVNKNSVESAIILAKRLEASRASVMKQQGTLVELLSNEFESEELINSILNNPAIDIDAIIRGDESIEGLTSIVTNLLNNTTDEDEAGISITANILDVYSTAIGKKVADNLELMKGFIIPLVGELRDTLINTYNNYEKNVNGNDVKIDIRYAKLDGYWTTVGHSAFSNDLLAGTYGEPVGGCPLEGHDELFDVIINRTPPEVESLKCGLGTDVIKSIVKQYITSDIPLESKVKCQSLEDLGIIYSFFYSILKNSRLNSIDVDELVKRASINLSAISSYVNEVGKQIEADEVNGIIISSYPKGNRDVVLRSSLNCPNIVYVIAENVKDFQDVECLVGGILTKVNIPVNITKQQILSNNSYSEIVNYFHEYKAKLNSTRTEITRDRKTLMETLTNEALPVVDKLKVIDSGRLDFRESVLYCTDEFISSNLEVTEKTLFDLACVIVGRLLGESDSLDIVEYIRSLDSHFEGNEDADVGFEMTKFVNRQIVLFLTRQIYY